jgi:hypothetical protein
MTDATILTLVVATMTIVGTTALEIVTTNGGEDFHSPGKTPAKLKHCR